MLLKKRPQVLLIVHDPDRKGVIADAEAFNLRTVLSRDPQSPPSGLNVSVGLEKGLPQIFWLACVPDLGQLRSEAATLASNNVTVHAVPFSPEEPFPRLITTR